MKFGRGISTQKNLHEKIVATFDFLRNYRYVTFILTITPRVFHAETT